MNVANFGRRDHIGVVEPVNLSFRLHSYKLVSGQ